MITPQVSLKIYDDDFANSYNSYASYIILKEPSVGKS